jgi:hypothetical protein
LKTKCSFVCYLFCKTVWRCLILLRSSNFLNRWQNWVSRTSCKKWTSIFFECCAESMHCSKLKKWFERTWRSLSTTSRRSWRCTTCESFQYSRRRNRDCHYHCCCHYHCFCRFFFFVCCFDRLDLIDSFDFDDLVLNEMLVSTFVLHVIIAFTMNAMLHLNDDDVLDFENDERRNIDDDCHDHD